MLQVLVPHENAMLENHPVEEPSLNLEMQCTCTQLVTKTIRLNLQDGPGEREQDRPAMEVVEALQILKQL